MQDCKPCPSPASSTTQLSQNIDAPFPDQFLYRSTIGTLQYLSITRPEISFITNKLSQFMQSPLDTHWSACKRVLRYLKGSLHHGIFIQSSSHQQIQGFTDADWASNVDDRRSTGGYCVFVGDNLVSWS